MKCKYFMILILVLLAGCTSFDKDSVSKRYTKLDNKFYQLTDDEIDEKKRAKLEDEFIEFSKGMSKYKMKNPEEDTQYIDEFIKKTDIKIEYLNDLKD
ncbi:MULTISPECIES: hypothetical protein [Fusobacterium]|uniref:Lipoprotein n=1 Tax=Fusobacterium hominis TaxID=2764326 RepID=A0A7G9GXZ7_9FUSO|nr:MULTISPECIES: hypothetical protein [Fusobacterium]QNM15679.1 hypothetical protein H9Q81_02230 [Fusobacterium hominis]